MATQTILETTTDEAAVRQTIEDHNRAVGEKNAAKALSYFADDVIRFDLAPPLVQAGEAALHRKEMDSWFATWRGLIGIELRDLAIEAGGDVAFARCLTRIHGTKVDGEAVDMWIRSTFGLRRIGGAWKIVHEHTSVPFYMDGSYKAAIDLKP